MFFLKMDQYMALSKKDLMIHITLNELYNTHSLLLQHVDTLVRSTLSMILSFPNILDSPLTTSNIFVS